MSLSYENSVRAEYENVVEEALMMVEEDSINLDKEKHMI